MAKTTVVLMTKNGPRILVNPPNINELRANPNAHFDIEAVPGVPPHEWTLPKFIPDENVINIIKETKRLKRKAFVNKALFIGAIALLAFAIVYPSLHQG